MKDQLTKKQVCWVFFSLNEKNISHKTDAVKLVHSGEKEIITVQKLWISGYWHSCCVLKEKESVIIIICLHRYRIG